MFLKAFNRHLYQVTRGLYEEWGRDGIRTLFFYFIQFRRGGAFERGKEMLTL